MTTKQNKAIPSKHRIDQDLSNETNTDYRKVKDDIDDISKIATSVRPKHEILRVNSPTFKRLVTARIKLEKYVSCRSTTLSPSQQFPSETSNYEKPSTATAVRVYSSSQKRIKSKSKPRTAPLDKITYEKTWTNNGNVKQKCSLEIWLPKAGSDDEEGNTSRTGSPDHHTNENEFQTPKSTSIKSRRSSTTKFSITTTAAPSQAKSLDGASSKMSEQAIIPRVYHYQEYLTDQPEEHSRSVKSGNTNRSDENSSNKSLKRQRIRGNPRRLSPTTNNTEESVHSATSTLPMSSKNLLANIKQTYAGHETKGTSNNNNSVMINELMRKYSMIKKSHQELTHPRLHLEKPFHDSKSNAHTTKDHSLPSPPATDSAPHISSDQPIVSVRKLLGDSSVPNSTGDYTSTKVLDHRSSHRKHPYVEVYPQTRLFSLVNHLHHRQASAAMSNAILPAVVGRRNEDPFRSLERSKTLDVVFAISDENTNKIPSRLPAQPDSLPDQPNPSNVVPRTTNVNEQTSPRLPKRSPPRTLRSEQPLQQTTRPLVQLVQYQNIQNTAQRYHLSAHPSSSSTTAPNVSTNTVFVHLKYSNGGNTDRHCLIPE